MGQKSSDVALSLPLLLLMFEAVALVSCQPPPPRSHLTWTPWLGSDHLALSAPARLRHMGWAAPRWAPETTETAQDGAGQGLGHQRQCRPLGHMEVPGARPDPSPAPSPRVLYTAFYSLSQPLRRAAVDIGEALESSWPVVNTAGTFVFTGLSLNARGNSFRVSWPLAYR